jgi:CRISPR-associated endoribonuclease Cas2, subtype I-E/ECOLI
VTVIVLTACTARLRGHLSRWLLEIAPGVFVGVVTARVREELWSRVAENLGSGKAFLVYSTRSEQKLAFDALNHDWEPRDYDGHVLMQRPHPGGSVGAARTSPEGWSVAARRRRFGRDIERIRRSQDGSTPDK